MVGNNLIAPGSIPPSARPPNLPASRKNRRLWFSSPASHVEHNSEKWQVESSFEWYLEKIQTLCFYATVDFPFLVLSLHPRSYENHVYSGSFQKNLIPDDSTVSWKQLLPSEQGLFRLSTGLPEELALGPLAFLTPIHPPLRSEAHLWSSFAIRSLSNLILPHHYFWRCVVKG